MSPMSMKPIARQWGVRTACWDKGWLLISRHSYLRVFLSLSSSPFYISVLCGSTLVSLTSSRRRCCHSFWLYCQLLLAATHHHAKYPLVAQQPVQEVHQQAQQAPVLVSPKLESLPGPRNWQLQALLGRNSPLVLVAKRTLRHPLLDLDRAPEPVPQASLIRSSTRMLPTKLVGLIQFGVR